MLAMLKRGSGHKGALARHDANEAAWPLLSNTAPACLPATPTLRAVEDGQELLNRELDVLQRLHDRGCGERVVCPLAQTRWEGKWFDDPEQRQRCLFQVRTPEERVSQRLAGPTGLARSKLIVVVGARGC